ncbi:MAG: hypothetical protein QF464_08095 [Myxococcota bacterium]|jgi:hypothetical protein|nr:hypothetical protein [Myxococcota bacterium]
MRRLPAVVGALFVGLVVWPLTAGMTLAGDEYSYRTVIDESDGLWHHLVALWESRIFRPLDLLGGYLTDPTDLDARATMLLHVPCLVAMVAALRSGMRRLAPDAPAAWLIAAMVVGLHTATSVVLWLPAAISQTAAGACGLWLGLVLWRGLDAARAAEPVGRAVMKLTVLALVGVHCRETFYGWCVSGLLVIGCVGWVAKRRDPTHRWRPWLALALPLLLVPLCHVIVRTATGGMGEMFEVGPDRYQLHGPLDMVRHGALSLIGQFTLGPVHMARGLGEPFLRVVTLGGILLTAALALKALSRPEGRGVVLAVALYTFASVAPMLPAGAFSEVYLMGPNAGAAMLVTLGLLAGWRGHRRRAWVAVALVVATIGAYGLVSRAVHYELTWQYSATLQRQIADFQAARPPSASPADVLSPTSCNIGPSHSQYVQTPIFALRPYWTERWVNARHPERPIRVGALGADETPGALVLDCSALPERPRW